VLGRLLAALLAHERAARSLFRQIGLGQALDVGQIPQEALDWYVALLRYTDTLRNEVESGPQRWSSSLC
jgi:hypothetical protein